MVRLDERQMPLMPEVINDRIARRKEKMSELGKKGGRSKSPDKLKACTKNLKKAQAARWPGRPQVVKYDNREY
jgi:general stress protein YciG